jgi:hypothetical protein
LELNAFNEKKDDDYSMSDSSQDHVDDAVRPKSFPLKKTNLIHRAASGDRASPVTSPKTKANADPPPMRIQKLEVKKAQPPPPKPKPKQDDFFAEMGFSAKPTFSHTPPPAAARQAAPRSSPLPVSTNGSRWQATSTTPGTGSVGRPATTTMRTSLGASVLAADSDDDDLGDGTDWGDDADLDDLLDD